MGTLADENYKTDKKFLSGGRRSYICETNNVCFNNAECDEGMFDDVYNILKSYQRLNAALRKFFLELYSNTK